MKKIILATILFITTSAYAQNDNSKQPPINWQLMDRKQDTVYGTSVNKAYAELLKGKKSHSIIVAVIDVGVDTVQEDLKGHIWTNTKEIPGNGIDDDHNGYIDDVHGWNFLGGKDGRNILTESLESTREYYRLRPQYATISDSSAASTLHLKEYNYWMKVKTDYVTDSTQKTVSLAQHLELLQWVSESDSILRAVAKKDTLFYPDIEAVKAQDSLTIHARNGVLDFFQQNNIPHSVAFESFITLANEYVENDQAMLQSIVTDPNAQRRDIIGDDPENINDKNYGNNDVSAGYQPHGTHLSGIIAAIRGNSTGMDGITDNVIIMPVRAACAGDERDKDVALAIRYAADNGAKIINMSFGKSFSPHKEWVDDAVRYAEKKGVLLIHAAGNEATDIDTFPSYPTPGFINSGEKAGNFITVGASTAAPDSVLCAYFSNYGLKNLDIFAPGVNIYSSIPGNKYIQASGTSAAAPVVAGIAALVWEYYPTLTYKQVKECIEQSATPINTLVIKPGTNDKVPFSSLSRTGGIVNAYKAIEIADAMMKKNK